MKGNNMRQLGGSRILKTVGASLAVGLGMTACSRDYTVDYLYVTCATKTTTGAISAYEVDYQSGALTPLADSPIPSGGNNPVALVAAPNQKFIYVINQAAPSSNVVEFSIGTDGKLYPENTYPVVQNSGATIIGSLPTAIAIDPTGKFLYITFEYQNGYSATSPGPGGMAVYPINADGSLGSPVMNGNLPYFATGDNPVGDRGRSEERCVCVCDRPGEAGERNALRRAADVCARNQTTGALTPVVGAVSGGISAGTTPAGIAEDPGSNFIYVTDETTNQLYGYLATGGTATGTGTPPLAMVSSPFTTGSFPEGVTIDPRGEYVYTANYNSDTVSAFAINVGTGALSSVAGSAGNDGCDRTDVRDDRPGTGHLSVHVEQRGCLGERRAVESAYGCADDGAGNAKFPADTLPTCAVAVGNGAHASQIVE